VSWQFVTFTEFFFFKDNQHRCETEESMA